MITHEHYRPFELPSAHRILIILAMLVAFLIVLLWPNPAPKDQSDRLPPPDRPVTTEQIPR